MKIIQILPSLELGGMERLAVDLARQQIAEGHEPSIYCTSHPGQFAPEAEAANVPVHSFGKATGFSPRLIRDLVLRLRVDRPDVLHAHRHNPRAGAHPSSAALPAAVLIPSRVLRGS